MNIAPKVCAGKIEKYRNIITLEQHTQLNNGF